MAAETLVPSSLDEAVRLFGDGEGITVFAGGTILMPEIAAGRLKPARALLLHRSGLDELRTELFGLHEGVAREELPRDSRREPEIVLDAGARAGLAAGCAGLHDKNVQAFRGRVDRGRKTGRTRPDHDKVVAAGRRGWPPVRGMDVPDEGRVVLVERRDQDGSLRCVRHRSRRGPGRRPASRVQTGR